MNIFGTNSIFDIVVMLWPLWLLLVAVFIIRIIFEIWLPNTIKKWKNKRRFQKGEAWRSDQQLILWLRKMSPKDFEVYIADLFDRLHYKTQVVGGSHDGGIDVIAEKDGVVNYIQCKKFITQQVTVGAMRDFYGALANKLATGKGYFITTNVFTLEAKQFAEDKPIELIDGAELVRYIRLVQKTEVNSNSTASENSKCPKCGGNLIEKSGKFGRFIGCSNYPKCDYTRRI